MSDTVLARTAKLVPFSTMISMFQLATWNNYYVVSQILAMITVHQEVLEVMLLDSLHATEDQSLLQKKNIKCEFVKNNCTMKNEKEN